MADPNFKNRRTPGVYVSEVSAFPPSAVGVETAVPAFIGYTERAEVAGVPATLVPVRVASMMEFEQYFGRGVLDVVVPGKPPAWKFSLKPVSAPGQGTAPPPAGGPGKSEGTKAEGRAETKAETKSEAKGDANAKGAQASTPAEGAAAATDAAAPPKEAVPPPGSYDIAYKTADGTASVYAKVTPRGPLYALYNSLRLFYANGGGPCYIVSVGSYADPISSEALIKGLDAVRDTQGPTLLVIPDASLLPVGEYGVVARAMMKQAHDKQDRAALLDVAHARPLQSPPGPALADAITAFRASVGTENLSYGMAYFPYLNTNIIKAADLDYTLFPPGELADYLLAEWQKAHPPGPASADDFRSVRETMRQGWPREKEEQALLPKIGNVVNDLAQTNPAGAKQLEFLVKRMQGIPVDRATIRSRNQDLVNVFPQLTQLLETAARQMNLLPPSPAMAGVMTVVDNTRGVWNAPANFALNAVDSVALPINDETQADLNKPLDGKAVNVIREFVGRGPIVWGARTLDGNSNDYRYVQVRRTLIYIEQSIKAAMNPFVFAPNDGNTWVAVMAMVSNFLQNLWGRGGLMGATPQEAFSVNCGLGTTMSAQDVLEGYMVVQVLVQLIHPAEFIELTFKQKMEAVG
jgi:phage tail sheath protein FI